MYSVWYICMKMQQTNSYAHLVEVATKVVISSMDSSHSIHCVQDLPSFLYYNLCEGNSIHVGSTEHAQITIT